MGNCRSGSEVLLPAYLLIRRDKRVKASIPGLDITGAVGFDLPPESSTRAWVGILKLGGTKKVDQGPGVQSKLHV
jgi:hypothetical protein